MSHTTARTFLAYSESMSHPLQTHQRQVHLDFHTSPYIGDVGSEFDAEEFASTVQEARINSITVFAKCHHGQCYYPAKVGVQHPALKGRDLLGEQIEALHRKGIRAPIYTTVAWEEDAADRYPQWRQLRHDGSFAKAGTHPGAWRFNNFLHPDYQEYIEGHIREIFSRYEVDGIFFDIVFFDGDSCWSDSCVRFREKHGLLGTDHATRVRFQTEAQVAFADRFSKLIRGLNPASTVFYNSPNPIFADAGAGVRRRHDLQTHWELESLPSGFWGYHHFPRLARAFGHWGKPWLGMTGRFQKSWGDFGGLKPQPALEYECFRSQALGGANSIGDQLPPRGTLDRGAYQLIGKVFAQCEAAEPFYAGSTSLPQIGIVAPGDESLPENISDLSLEGAVQMCDEAHYDSVVLDDASSFDGLDLLILPDSVSVTPSLLEQLQSFAAAGGKVIFSGRSAFDAEGHCVLPGAKLQRRGTVEKYPTYWRATEQFSPDLALSDRVVYLPGENVTGEDVEILSARVLPYFKRTDLTFSSHFQTPPVAAPDTFAAVLAGRNFVYFADPIFREYRESGNIAVRDGWKAGMERLIGPAPIGAGLPSTILSVPRRKGNDLLITLLHYIPTRKALQIDMIEERSSFAGEVLKLPARANRVVDAESGVELKKVGEGSFELPAKKGRLLLRCAGYFG